jgi:hypothetical protein
MGMMVFYWNRFIFPLSLAILFAGFLPFSSCASGGNPRESGLPKISKTVRQETAGAALAPYTANLQIPLWKELPSTLTAKSSPVLAINLKLIDFAASPAGSPKQLFDNVFYRGLSVQDYARELTRVQTIEYQEMGEEVRNNPVIMNSAALNWYYSEDLDAPAAGPRLLVISRDRAFYSGGAHPNSDRAYFVFDREEALQIRLPDIIPEESMSALRRLANRELRAGKKLGPSDSLKKALFFVDEAEIPENFFFSPQGLGLHWNPYEIAPYSEGYVEVIIPFGEIKNLLSPRGQYLAGELWKE